LSKELVTILTEVDLTCAVTELEKRDMDLDACAEKFTELEFHALIRQLTPESKSVLKPRISETEKQSQTILSKKGLEDLVKELGQAKRISFDLETTSVLPMEADIVGLSFSTGSDSGWYIPILYQEKEKNNFGKNDMDTVLKELEPIFQDSSRAKTGQNIKYDALILKQHGITVRGIEFDTMLFEY
jgi:DNA polymerase-1